MCNLIKFSVVLINLFIIRTTVIQCFNIEERDPIVKTSNDPTSFFGYSVAQHKVRENDNSPENTWILVGAPLAQNLQPGTTKSGALFKCPITQIRDDCKQIETDGKRIDFDYDDVGDESLKPPGSDEIKSGQWLGVSVSSQKPGGNVVVCAHRYIQSQNLSQHHYGYGLCYLLNNELQTIQDLQPCKGRSVEKLHQQFGLCQVGTSVKMLEDGRVLMGAPGPYTWRGTVFEQEVVGDFLTRDKNIYHGPFTDEPKPLDKYSYLGMSVTGGTFFDKGQIGIAAGAPRSNFTGQVLFFEKESKNQMELQIPLTLDGDQFASSFGYEIAAVDVNNDGYDDLLVSAPFYYDHNIGGAVYIYTNLRACREQKNHNCSFTKLTPGPQGSRFGFAISGIGDINKDGYDDVAIGAPYEGYGAVYIYLGSKDGLNKEPSQKIMTNFPTFGYSLSGGLDMDDNLYPDLVVGAYESDRVFLYKTRPIVDIVIDFDEKSLKKINVAKKGCEDDPKNTNNTCFSFSTCFTLKGELRNKVSVNYFINETTKNNIPRIWFHDSKHKNKRSGYNKRTVDASSNQKVCLKERIYIKEGIESTGDIVSPIKFKVRFTLQDESYHSPILNKTSVKDFEAHFQNDCGEDNVCHSYLELDTPMTYDRSISDPDCYEIINLPNQEFLLNITVKNTNESAYKTRLMIYHPKELSYIALKSDAKISSSVRCSTTNDNLIDCDVGNPLKANELVFLTLRFEIRKSDDFKFDLDVKVNTTSENLSPKNSTKVCAAINRKANFVISSKATTNLFYGGIAQQESEIKNIEDIGPKVRHIYNIENKDGWQLQDVTVVIKWPAKVGNKWLLYLQDTPTVYQADGKCTVNPEDMVNPLELNTYGSDETDNITAHSLISDSITERFLRRKRDVSPMIPIEEKEINERKRKIAEFQCYSDAMSCITIECKIPKLIGDCIIDINARFWNSTLVDYSNVDWVSIKSGAQVYIGNVKIDENAVTATSAETIAYPEVVQPDKVNYLIIVIAVLIGLLLLIILIVVLYKCGFFKRNRVKDHTLSGNLHTKAEQDSLLKNK